MRRVGRSLGEVLRRRSEAGALAALRAGLAALASVGCARVVGARLAARGSAASWRARRLARRCWVVGGEGWCAVSAGVARRGVAARGRRCWVVGVGSGVVLVWVSVAVGGSFRAVARWRVASRPRRRRACGWLRPRLVASSSVRSGARRRRLAACWRVVSEFVVPRRFRRASASRVRVVRERRERGGGRGRGLVGLRVPGVVWCAGGAGGVGVLASAGRRSRLCACAVVRVGGGCAWRGAGVASLWRSRGGRRVGVVGACARAAGCGLPGRRLSRCGGRPVRALRWRGRWRRCRRGGPLGVGRAAGGRCRRARVGAAAGSGGCRRAGGLVSRSRSCALVLRGRVRLRPRVRRVRLGGAVHRRGSEVWSRAASRVLRHVSRSRCERRAGAASVRGAPSRPRSLAGHPGRRPVRRSDARRAVRSWPAAAGRAGRASPAPPPTSTPEVGRVQRQVRCRTAASAPPGRSQAGRAGHR